MSAKRNIAEYTFRNCLHDGQVTNCRVNALILDQCLVAKAVDVWFLRTRNRHRIEDELLGLLQPSWNRQLGSRHPDPTRENDGGHFGCLVSKESGGLTSR
jgi:hypothetical protein